MNDINNVLVAKDTNGNRVVVIPQVIFKGKRTIPWDEVEQYLLRYVGKIFEVAETEDLIYVDRTFADEYANSIYTKKLVGALLKVKANMSQGIPQMIEIATSKRGKEDFEHRLSIPAPVEPPVRSLRATIPATQSHYSGGGNHHSGN